MEDQFDHDKYSAYLNQHLVAADAGVQAFKAAADTWQGTRWAAMFDQLHTEEIDSHAKVMALVESLGYEISTTRNVLSGVVAAVGRFNPLNPTRSRDGQMAQAEIDSLVSAIRAQQTMWDNLTVLADIDDRLDKADCTTMIERCKDQRARVRDMSQATIKERFTKPAEEHA